MSADIPPLKTFRNTNNNHVSKDCKEHKENNVFWLMRRDLSWNLKLLQKQEQLKFLNVSRVIVEVQSGESEEEADRHLTRHPEDRWAKIRIFNRQPHVAANS